MKAIKKPIPIEVVVFDPAAPLTLPIFVVWRRNDPLGYSVFNALHGSWIDVQIGDYLNVSDQTGRDIHPIDRATFERTYDVVD
jgi:hypothetical protein